VAELRARDITPGARMEIASIQATDRAIQQQVNDLRDELRAQRTEIRETMQRIELKLDEHDDPRR
jgi:predicted  nucleic acid-binding Zn-ribbon protein